MLRRANGHGFCAPARGAQAVGVLVGMDEAGYGPNLGPLVITATAWEFPGHPRETDLWKAFAPVVAQEVDRAGEKLHVADSKEVYSPGKGIRNLEVSALCLLGLWGGVPESLGELWQQLTGNGPVGEGCGPWYARGDLPLPRLADAKLVSGMVQKWRACALEQGITLTQVQSEIVLPQRFNRLTRELGTKGMALSTLSMGLLRRVLDRCDDDRVLVIADKHGGRNRYDGLLEEVAGDRFIFRQVESRRISSYRIDKMEIRFQTRAEAHLPVAAASLVCKYTRETAMELFNQFWCDEVAGLKPTKGYPVDAKRFRKEISAAQQRLEIDDEVLWRER